LISRCYRCGVILLLIALAGASCGQRVEEPRTSTSIPTAEFVGEQPLRLFFVRTYSEEDPWSNRIRTGVLERLAQLDYAQASQNLVLSEFALRAETLRDSVEIEDRATAAIQEIKEFNPDVVIVADDEAARWVIRGYPDPTLPFIFCGLNSSAWEHGLSRPNVTGVLERTYPLQTVHLASAMKGQVPEKVLFLSDESIASTSEGEEVRAALLDAENALVEETVLHQTNDWEAWQTFVLEKASTFDVLLLGYFKNLVNDYGDHIPERTVLRWTLGNSSIPVFGLQLNTNEGGAVGGLAVSGYAQGQEAAELAVEIFRGTEPASLSHRVPGYNVLVVNLVAARYWDLDVPLELLIGARIERNFPIALGGE
jgi:ABC-type uncharacterized transport system substrate-binding protein